MCGIAGLASPGARSDGQSIVRTMCDRMTHRGPDDDGYFGEQGIALGVRRLSIVDVACGHQPISNGDGSVVVVQNGEIYNFSALRAELEAHGHRFKTRCDTEVLVHAYDAWGDAFVERLNGMFAFALWDRPRRRLMLARDRMGIKPLYYAERDGRLGFASELKALLEWPGITRTLDRRALRDYLVLEYVPTPDTMIEGVRQLPPGSVAVFEDGRLDVRQFWDLKLATMPCRELADEATLAARLRERLWTAVQLELLSDVPVGVLLSGGLDSSSIAAAMVDLCGESGQPVQSFSVGFSAASFDESRYASLVAEHLGTEHHTLMVEPHDVAALVPKLAEIVDVPLGDASIVPTYLLSKFARERVTVALGGEGGDEVFGGYPTLQAHRASAFVEWLPRPLLRAMHGAAQKLPSDSRNISLDFKVKRFLAGVSEPTPLRHHIWMGALDPAAAHALLAPELRASLAGTTIGSTLLRHARTVKSASRIDQVLYLDAKMYLENDILVKTDRASMACSLETRVPLLNRVLVDFMAELPADLKLRGFRTKHLLKRAMRGILPDAVIDRPKKGFNFPVAQSLRTVLRPMMLDALSSDRVRRQGLFDAGGVERLVREHLSGRYDHRKPLWTLLVFQLWHAAFIERGQAGVSGAGMRCALAGGAGTE